MIKLLMSFVLVAFMSATSLSANCCGADRANKSETKSHRDMKKENCGNKDCDMKKDKASCDYHGKKAKSSCECKSGEQCKCKADAKTCECKVKEEAKPACDCKNTGKCECKASGKACECGSKK